MGIIIKEQEQDVVDGAKIRKGIKRDGPATG